LTYRAQVDDAPAGAAKFLYDSNDLYDAAHSLVFKTDKELTPAGFTPFLKLPSIQELCQMFSGLGNSFSHLGLDENSSEQGAKVNSFRYELGERVIQLGTVTDVREHLKRGASPALRGRLWRRALCLCATVCGADRSRYAEVCRELHRLDLASDEMVLHDVMATAEDPSYFVFEVS
jgi:hypothetical protein